MWIQIKQFMCFNQDGANSSLNDKPLKLVNQFIHFSSSISSTESNVIIPMVKIDSVWLS